MKKLLAALLFIAAPLAAQDASINKDGSGGTSGGGGVDDAEYITCAAHADLSAEIPAGDADACLWWATPSSSNMRGTMSDESGTGFMMFNNGPALQNGASGPGYLDFSEDTDNGSNRVRLIGPSSTADVTITMPASTGTMTLDDIANAWADGIKQTFNPDGTNAGINVGSQAGNPSAAAAGDLWYNSTIGGTVRVGIQGVSAPVAATGVNFIRFVDDFICGPQSVTSAIMGSCLGVTGLGAGTSAGTTQPGTSEVNHPGVGEIATLAAGGTSNAIMHSSSATAMYLVDGARSKWIVKTPSALSTSGDIYILVVGSCDCTGTGLGSDGIYFHYTSDVGNTTPNWGIVVQDGGVTAPVSTGVVFAVDTWYTLEWWYEAGVGVHFYINGTETAGSPINAGNEPTGIGELYRTFFAKVQNTSGTATAEVMLVDYMEYSMPLSGR